MLIEIQTRFLFFPPHRPHRKCTTTPFSPETGTKTCSHIAVYVSVRLDRLPASPYALSASEWFVEECMYLGAMVPYVVLSTNEGGVSTLVGPAATSRVRACEGAVKT